MVYRQLPCLKFWAKYNERYLMADKDLTKPTEIEFCTGSFSAVDTAEFKAVGGFDEDYFMYVEDADLTQKMRTTGAKRISCPSTRPSMHGTAQRTAV